MLASVLLTVFSAGCFDFDGAYHQYVDGSLTKCPPAGNLGSNYPHPLSELPTAVLVVNGETSVVANPSGQRLSLPSHPIEVLDMACLSNAVLAQTIAIAPTSLCPQVAPGSILVISVVAQWQDVVFYRTVHSLTCP